MATKLKSADVVWAENVTPEVIRDAVKRAQERADDWKVQYCNFIAERLGGDYKKCLSKADRIKDKFINKLKVAEGYSDDYLKRKIESGKEKYKEKLLWKFS